MKKLSSIFIAFALFCFVMIASSCQGSGSADKAKEESTEKMTEEAATDVVEEPMDSTMTEGTEGEEMTDDSSAE